MKADEKLCPKCAETIKKAAHLCKHCGHQFSEAELAAAWKREQDGKKATNIGCIVTVVVLVLLVAMCSRIVGEAPEEKASGEANSEENYADTGKQSAWIEASKEAIRQRLRDPDSAEFRNVHFYSGGASPVACGEVNARNGFGGFTGFERFVAAGNVGKLAFLASDLSSASEMDNVWKEMCVKAPTDTQ